MFERRGASQSTQDVAYESHSRVEAEFEVHQQVYIKRRKRWGAVGKREFRHSVWNHGWYYKVSYRIKKRPFTLSEWCSESDLSTTREE